MTDFAEALRALPKAELHVHLDGSIRPQTLLDLYRVAGRDAPAARAEQVATAIGAGRQFDGLPDYLKVFDHTLPAMQTEPALRRVAQELVEDAARDGVHHIEVRFCPDLHRKGGLEHDAILTAVTDGLREGERRLGVSFGVIVTALRNRDSAESEALARLAARFSDRAVVAFDLAGDEEGFPCHVHRTAFDLARDAGLKLTLHAGEVAGPEAIAEALEQGAHRIGHGTHLRDDPMLLERVREAQIPLEMCPTSNVQTRSVESYSDHPALDYHRQGIAVTVSTDARLISNTTVSGELARLRESHRMTWEEAQALARASFQAAFIDETRRSELIGRVATIAGRLREAGFDPDSTTNGEDLAAAD